MRYLSRIVRIVLPALALALPVAAAAQATAPPASRSPWRAADSVTVNEDNDTQKTTYSQ
jgi:hypothetical protein